MNPSGGGSAGAGASGSHRAEAERCLSMAQKLLISRDFDGCRQFAVQALSADPLVPGADELLAAADVLLANHGRRCPPSSGFRGPDPYAILGLSSSTPSSRDPDLVHYHYRRLFLLLSNVSPSHPSSPVFADASRVVADAWTMLSDPARKAFLDAHFDVEAQAQAGANAAAETRAATAPADAAAAAAPARVAATAPGTEAAGVTQAVGSSSVEKNLFDEPVLEAVTPLAAITPASSVPAKRPRGRPRGSGRGRSGGGAVFNSEPEKVRSSTTSTGKRRGRPPGRGRGRGRGRERRSVSPIGLKSPDGDQSTPSSAAVPPPLNPQPVASRPSETFWTACPTCCHVHEYDKQYEAKNLLCPNCKEPFYSVAMLVAPPIVPGTDMYYCSWGFFPLGYPGGPKFAEMPQFKKYFTKVGQGISAGDGGGRGLDGMTPPKKSKKVVAKKRVMSNFGEQSSTPKYSFIDMNEEE